MTIEQALTQGVQLQQAGRLPEAERVYRQILQAAPNHPDALHLLGLIAFEHRRRDEALDLLRRAIAINPSSGSYQCNLGRILSESGQIDQAIAAFREAMRLQPQNADAWNNLGAALLKEDQLKESIEAFEQAIALRTQFVEARNNLGQALLTQGRIEPAIVLFREAIALNPKYAAAHANLGIALNRQNKLPEATESFRTALAREPDNPEAQINFGKILQAGGRLDQAMTIFRSVIAAHPQKADAHRNLGEAFLAKNRRDEAIASLNAALALDPRSADLLNNLGHAFHAAGEFEQAETCYRKAIELRPNWPLVKYNLGINCLLRGDFAQGWALYESRVGTADLGRNYLDFPQPRWDGGDLNGRRILLHAEQGLGDAIQFIRYVPRVAQRGGKIILHVQPDLVRLFGRIPNVENITAFSEKPADFDVQCPLMSLPLILGGGAEIPSEVPYLMPDAQAVEHWRSKLGDEAGYKVGLVWAGKTQHQNDRNRSMPAQKFASLSQVPSIRFFSLQKGDATKQFFGLSSQLNISDLAYDLNDFTDTAALIQNLDLLITVDTAVAHLAGAMGKAVWVLLPFVPDWRWLLNRSDSIWYPTMRLFRQSDLGDWDAVVQDVVRALPELKMK